MVPRAAGSLLKYLIKIYRATRNALLSDRLNKFQTRTRSSVFAQEVDGGGSEGMLLNRSSKRLLSNHLEQ